MTGKHPGHAFIRNNGEIKPEGQRPIPKKEITIAEVLKAAGYATAMAGKWHLGNGDANHPSTHGFDEALTVPWTTDMACYEPWPCRYDHATLEHGTLSVGNAQMRREFVATLASCCSSGADGQPPRRALRG